MSKEIGLKVLREIATSEVADAGSRYRAAATLANFDFDFATSALVQIAENETLDAGTRACAAAMLLAGPPGSAPSRDTK